MSLGACQYCWDEDCTCHWNNVEKTTAYIVEALTHLTRKQGEEVIQAVIETPIKFTDSNVDGGKG